MWLIIIAILVAVVYFPVVYVANKIGGEKVQTVVIVVMMAGVFATLCSIPVLFFLFLRFGF